MTYQSEHELEELLIRQLVAQGYDRVGIRDEEDLKANFRVKLFEFNKDKLNGKPLTDKEFNRILIHLENKSIYRSAKLFRDKFILEREDGTSVYIEFFDSKNWHNNIIIKLILITVLTRNVTSNIYTIFRIRAEIKVGIKRV